MKKVGLVCNYYMLNYGSLLQCYATVKAIKDMGYDIEAIQFENIPTKKAKKQLILRLKIKQLFKPSAILKKLERIKNTNYNSEYDKLRKKRKERFDIFVKDNIPLSQKYNSLEEVAEHCKDYDVIALGSDQLLCPKDIIMGYHSLEFAPDDIKKISYAASFGLSKLPMLVKKKAARDLKRFDCFAAREIAGEKIYKDLTGKSAPVVVDPTLLLSRDKWLEVAGEKPLVDGEYIFCYFIGDNEKHREMANIIKEKTGLKIATIRHIDDYISADEGFGDVCINDAGPVEFTNMILNAKYVLSDSFHSTIFSIMYHKKFLVFNRFAEGSSGSTNSRIDSLLEMLSLQDRRTDDKEKVNDILNRDIDYENVDSKLESWIKDSKDYLKGAID